MQKSNSFSYLIYDILNINLYEIFKINNGQTISNSILRFTESGLERYNANNMWINYNERLFELLSGKWTIVRITDTDYKFLNISKGDKFYIINFKVDNYGRVTATISEDTYNPDNSYHVLAFQLGLASCTLDDLRSNLSQSIKRVWRDTNVYTK